MAGYSVNSAQTTSQNLSTTAKTQIRITNPASGMKRCRFWEFEVSAIGAPNASDGQILSDFVWCDATTAGTIGTTATPEPLDHGTAIGTAVDVAVTAAPLNYTVEPTAYLFTHDFWTRGFNQRSGVLWQAQPGREIITPAVASIGPGMRASANTYTNTVASRINYDEL